MTSKWVRFRVEDLVAPLQDVPTMTICDDDGYPVQVALTDAGNSEQTCIFSKV